MTPSEEKTVDEKMREAGQTAETLRRYLGWDKEALAIVMLQDPEATMKFKASHIQDIWNHCVSLRLTNQRLEAEVTRMKETIGDMANRAVQLIGSSTCDKHTQAIKEMPFDKFIAWHKSLPCFYCMEAHLRDLESQKGEKP